MKKTPHYRLIIYGCTILTGMTGLIFQVTWQKYLAILVGSEARSVTLVVAFFLLGLATGYWYWGKQTESERSRQGLLRIYGLAEIGIGAYGVLFPCGLRG